MNLRSFLIFALVLAVTLLGSCASVNRDSFLINNLDNKTKSKVLVDAGAREWNDSIVDQGQIERINEVREYFVVASTYNPQNPAAQRWLTAIEDYRNSKLHDTINDARNLLKNRKGKESDDYALAVAVRRATLIDPANGEVIKLQKDTQTIRSNLAKVYMKRADNSLAKLDINSSDAVHESIYIDAFQDAVRATVADPKDGSAAKLKSSLAGQIMTIIKKRLAGLSKYYEAARFSAAKAQIDIAADLSRKSRGDFDTAINNAYYDLYSHWAQYNYAHKDYSQAENRIERALNFKSTREATALQARISKQLDQIDNSVSFDANIQNIDRLIAAGDLVPAQRQLTGLSATFKDQTSQNQLQQRRKKIQDTLADMYARSVQFYKNEDFGSAIDLLETVTSIDPEYEQAADYLAKAQQKKKLLDNF